MSIESDIVEVKSIGSYGIKIVNSYSDFDLMGKRFNSSPLVYYYNTFGCEKSERVSLYFIDKKGNVVKQKS